MQSVVTLNSQKYTLSRREVNTEPVTVVLSYQVPIILCTVDASGIPLLD